MKNEKTHVPTGINLRRRVRALTVGVTGAAVLATAGVSATMAYGQSAPESTAGSAEAVAGDPTRSGTTSSSAASATSPDAAALGAPLQLPTGTNNNGSSSITGHASSGGS